MSRHPRERRTGLSRREFLRRSIGAAVVLPSASAILAACAKPGSDTGGDGGETGRRDAFSRARTTPSRSR